MNNIVALKHMAHVPGFPITMDISKERAITVDYQYNVYKFKKCQDGLYYYETVVDNHISGATNKSNSPFAPLTSLLLK